MKILSAKSQAILAQFTQKVLISSNALFGKILSPSLTRYYSLGVVQKLRGQEEVSSWSLESPRLVT